MKVYVAAPWIHRNVAADFAIQCEAQGHTITREWWKYEAGDEEFDVLRAQAIADLDAVQDADVVVVLQIAKSEGKAAETGAALAWRIPVFALIYDKPGNIFHRHPGVTLFYTHQDVLDALLNLETKLPNAA